MKRVVSEIAQSFLVLEIFPKTIERKSRFMLFYFITGFIFLWTSWKPSEIEQFCLKPFWWRISSATKQGEGEIALFHLIFEIFSKTIEKKLIHSILFLYGIHFFMDISENKWDRAILPSCCREFIENFKGYQRVWKENYSISFNFRDILKNNWLKKSICSVRFFNWIFSSISRKLSEIEWFCRDTFL